MGYNQVYIYNIHSSLPLFSCFILVFSKYKPPAVSVHMLLFPQHQRTPSLSLYYHSFKYEFFLCSVVKCIVFLRGRNKAVSNFENHFRLLWTKVKGENVAIQHSRKSAGTTCHDDGDCKWFLPSTNLLHKNSVVFTLTLYYTHKTILFSVLHYMSSHHITTTENHVNKK